MEKNIQNIRCEYCGKITSMGEPYYRRHIIKAIFRHNGVDSVNINESDDIEWLCKIDERLVKSLESDIEELKEKLENL